MSIFKRKHSKPEPAAVIHVECRSWNGTAIHIRDRRDETGQALCGYDPLDDLSEATVDKFLSGLEREHAGWHYCRGCGAKFLGIHGAPHDLPPFSSSLR